MCVTATCTDGMQDGNETGVDCGGSCDAQGKTCANGVGCLVNADCTSAYCNSGTCAAAPDGDACTASSQCASGNCVSGICCNTSCGGNCQACTHGLTGVADGTCANITAGLAAPAGQCPATTCGNDGKCDGTGACEQVAAGTPCGAAACAAGMLYRRRHLQRRQLQHGRHHELRDLCLQQRRHGLPDELHLQCSVRCIELLQQPRPQRHLRPAARGRRRLRSVQSVPQRKLRRRHLLRQRVLADLPGVASVTGGRSGTCANVTAGSPPRRPLHGQRDVRQHRDLQRQRRLHAGRRQPSRGRRVVRVATFTPSALCSGGGTCSTPTTSSCAPYICGRAARAAPIAPHDAQCVPIRREQRPTARAPTAAACGQVASASPAVAS